MSFFKNIFNSNNEQESTPTSTVGWRQLTDFGQLNEIIDASTEKPVLIFKHSTRCYISKSVLKQFENEFKLQDSITPYFLDLLAHREVSNEIANRFGVEHQSPQLIVIKNGKAIFHASHSDIDAALLDRFI